jgi:hypothetical protein
MEEGRVLYYLDIWRDYMQSNTHKLGYKSKSTGFISGGIHSFEDMAEENDISSARTIDQVIDDLPKLQTEAIHAVWLGQKTKIVPAMLELLYSNALHRLGKKLTEKNLY